MPLLTYDDRGALLKFWSDAGIHFKVVDGRLQFWADDRSKLNEAGAAISEHIEALKEELQYQAWAEQSLEERGMDLGKLTFMRWCYEQGMAKS